MSLRNASDKFRSSLTLLTERRVEYALRAAMDITALAKTRIINKRVDGFDQAYGEYADSTWKQKQRSNKGNNRAINFSETNRMWATTLPSITSVTRTQIEITVEPTDAGRAEVFGYHQKRFGPLIALNPRESVIFTNIYGNLLIKDLPKI